MQLKYILCIQVKNIQQDQEQKKIAQKSIKLDTSKKGINRDSLVERFKKTNL